MTGAESRAIEAAEKAHRIAARCFTLEEASNAIAAQEGLNETNKKQLLDDMLRSDRDGSLTVRSPTGHNLYAPYRPTIAREFDELTTPEDVNKWAAARGFGWRWKYAVGDEQSDTYQPLALLIEPLVNKPFDALDDGLQARFLKAFHHLPHWDQLNADQRRSMAQQHDIQHDPAMGPENKYWLALFGAEEHAKSTRFEWDQKQPQSITELKTKEDRLTAIDSRLRDLSALWKMPPFSVGNWDALTDNALAELMTASKASTPAQTVTPAPVDAVGASGGVEPDKAGKLPVGQGLVTIDIANTFDGLNGWNAERWRKNLSAAKWLHPARIARGRAGGASAVWCPVMLAQLMHDKAKGEREKGKLMNALNSRFTKNPVLKPWRDDFNEYLATYGTTE